MIAHPVFRSDPPRADDGRTVLAPGVIRPYKGLGDAVDAVLAVPDARLLVAGDPRIPLEPLRVLAGERAEWRLGYLGRAELERALSEATVAIFPYRAELDQSGALLQALGAGVPAVVYDVGGLGEPIRRYGAGRVVAPGDVAGLAEALRDLLDDPAALAEARARCRARPRRADLGRGCGRAPLALRGAHVRLGRRDAFDDLVDRQLTLFAEDEAELLDEAVEAEQAWVQVGPRHRRGGLRRLPARRRRGRRPSPRPAGGIRGNARTAMPPTRTGRRSRAGAARRFRRYASLVADLEL